MLLFCLASAARTPIHTKPATRTTSVVAPTGIMLPMASEAWSSQTLCMTSAGFVREESVVLVLRVAWHSSSTIWGRKCSSMPRRVALTYCVCWRLWCFAHLCCVSESCPDIQPQVQLLINHRRGPFSNKSHSRACVPALSRACRGRTIIRTSPKHTCCFCTQVLST